MEMCKYQVNNSVKYVINMGLGLIIDLFYVNNTEHPGMKYTYVVVSTRVFKGHCE